MCCSIETDYLIILCFDEKNQKLNHFFALAVKRVQDLFYFFISFLALLLSFKTLSNSYIYGQGEKNRILKCKFTAKSKKIKQIS
jgi:hypothetical protein